MSPSRAYQMIDAASVVEMISSTTVDEIIIPATESQARELAPLLDQPEELRDVWDETLQRTNGKPTAAAIRDVRRDRAEASVESLPEPEPAEPAEPDTAPPTDAPIPKASAPQRRPIVDTFRDAALTAVKDIDRLSRLLTDDRWPRNVTKVAPSIRNDLREALDRLTAVVESLPA